MKIKNFLTIALTGGLLLTGCNNEENPLGNGNQGELTYATVILQNGTLTKAADGTHSGTEEEREINMLEFYVFEEDGTRDSNTHNGYAKYEGSEAAGSQKYVPVNAGNKIILVAANMNLGTRANVDLAELKEVIISNTMPGTKPYEVPDDGIPMAGVNTTAVTVNTGTANTEVPVSLNRLYARINTPTTVSTVVVDIEDEYLESIDLDPSETITFDFQGYAVLNGINKSYVMSAAGLAGWTKDASMSYNVATYYGENDPQETGSIKSIYSGEKNSNGFFYSDEEEDFIYVYENLPQTKTNGTFELIDPASVYALIVKGTLSDGTETKTRYWRVNLAKEEDYKFYRNAYYNTLIQKVTTIGYNTPEEAEEDDNKPIPVPGETGIIAKITILDWTVFNGTTDL